MAVRDKKLGVRNFQSNLFEPRSCRYCGKKLAPIYTNQWVHDECASAYTRKYHRDYQRTYRKSLRRADA